MEAILKKTVFKALNDLTSTRHFEYYRFARISFAAILFRFNFVKKYDTIHSSTLNW